MSWVTAQTASTAVKLPPRLNRKECTYRTIIGVQDLYRHLHCPHWAIVDCRHDPFDFEAGRREYAIGHVPGAMFAHLAQDMSGKTDTHSGRHPLPEPDAFIEKLSQWGIDQKTQVVAYDDSGSTYAARFWWMCRWVGLERVAVLDGGWGKWVRDDAPISRHGESRTLALPIAAGTDRESWVDTQEMLSLVGRSDTLIIDARPADRFRGEQERQDPVAGHIPGARNRPYRDNLGANGCFLSAPTLRAQFLNLIGNIALPNVIQQCGAGVTACNNLLAMEIAGLPGSRLYPGSWSAWCSDLTRPFALSDECHP